MSLRRLGALGVVVLLAGLAGPGAAATDAGDDVPERRGPVLVIQVDGVINSAAADYVLQAIDRAEQTGAAILLFELDTPGGVVTDTKDIIQRMLNTNVPVVVFVRPRGAWAGSAGALITIAGHIAAMAPRTTIGAAHPVMSGTPNPKGERNEEGETEPGDYLMEKLENITAAYIEAVAEERGRNVEWAARAVRESIAASAEEALELNVIDLIALDRADLLAKIDGRVVVMHGDRVRIRTRGATVTEVEMSGVMKLFHAITHPQIISLLMLLGMGGLYFEYNNPGGILPGALGAVCLILGLIAMQAIPFSWVGIVFVVAGFALMVAEAFFPVYGILVLIGSVLLLVGGSMVFDRPEVSDLDIDFWSALVPLVATFAACMFGIIIAMGRTRSLAQVAGTHELVGLRGVAKTDLSPEGTVFIRGEYWTAFAHEEIPANARVEAVAVDGLRLEVKRADA